MIHKNYPKNPVNSKSNIKISKFLQKFSNDIIIRQVLSLSAVIFVLKKHRNEIKYQSGRWKSIAVNHLKK